MNNILQIEEFDSRLVQIHAQTFDFGWNDSDFSEYLKSEKYTAFGMYEAERLQAFVLISVVVDEAEILTIATDPAAQRRGHARALLQHLIAHLGQRHIHSLFLEVAVDNPAAIALYEGLGFRQVGRRPLYYSRRGGALVDALILSLAV
ncbi:ribosomal protein S18-alanine N-acetyltransferase [Asticcacaulis sp.]|uniref:ribosomal protein S18-alanine N-acetyltransferase n=1 Tax=Asticcacaulis sp. TaxID=1872648 RepID=UPI00262222BC|nr:ribosomal protein S18-alanine N-acetyltransferase [Asticcacaulis sp.]